MDIRNFFGGNKNKDTSNSSVISAVKPVLVEKKTNIIETPQTVAEKIEPSIVVMNQSNSIEGVVVGNEDVPVELIPLITWQSNESVPYQALVDAFDRCASTTGRLEKESILCNIFRCVVLTTPRDLSIIVHLASNTVAPAYENIELGIGDSLLVKAICEATGRKKESVEEDYKREGDLGVVALSSRACQKTLNFGFSGSSVNKTAAIGLSAAIVLENLKKIALTKGDKAQSRKVDIIKSLLIKCQGNEAKYLVRALQGKLRIGTANQTVLIALANAFILTMPGEVKEKHMLHQSSYKDNSSSSHNKPSLKKKTNAGSRKVSKKSNVISDDDDDEQETAPANEENDEASNSISADHENSMIVDDSSNAGDISGGTGTNNSIVTISEENCFTIIENLIVHEPNESRKLRCNYHQLNKQDKLELGVTAVKKAFSQCPNLIALTSALLTHPIYDIHHTCKLIPGIPIAPMLAKPSKEISEVLKRLNGLEFTMEYKYDGERAQIHMDENGNVNIFSRNSEDNTQKYPDLIQIVKQAKLPSVTSFVLDGEVVAYDREKQCLLPFQILSTRKRKVDESTEDINEPKVKIILQVFDCLYINGKSLLPESLKFRRNLLRSCFTHVEGYFHHAKGVDHLENGDTTPIEAFMQEACTNMCEGLMVKTLTSNASYEPSKRSLNWLKLKKDYIAGMGVCDSVDLVVIGGYFGRGKRTNVYGAYLMACVDTSNDEIEYQSVCKVGTGFKDEDLVRCTAVMNEHKIESNVKPMDYCVGDMLCNDIQWFHPVVVWELQAADLSLSSVHKGGLRILQESSSSSSSSNGEKRGIGLRFPRFLRERPDKKAENATNAEQIVDMYHSQSSNGNSNSGNNNNEGDEEDDYI